MNYNHIDQIENAQPFYFEGGDHGVLLIHGFTGSVAHMRPIGEGLNKAGFTVEGVNLLGQGTVLTDMKNIPWQKWTAQVEAAYLKLKKKCTKVSVAGLSMGGVLSLELAERQKPCKVITYSAPMDVKNPFAKWAKAAGKIYPITKWRTPKERARQLPVEFDIGYEGFPTQSVGELLGLINHTKANLAKVTAGLLVFQSHDDQSISADSGQQILQGVSSKEKELFWLEGIPHVITISKKMDTILEKTISFLSKDE